MRLLMEYNKENVLFFHYGDKDSACASMGNAIKIYWPKRQNRIARSRIKSACRIIRSIRNEESKP